MKNDDSMRRMKAAVEAIEKLLQKQNEEKAKQTMEEDADDTDLILDMLLEASDLLGEASCLVYQAEALLKGEDIEADCCFPCCIMEVYCDDEL